MEFAGDSFGFVHRREAIVVADDEALRREAASGELDRIWRGTYRRADAAPTTADERYRERVIAAALGGGGHRHVSHSSAAALHRLPLLDPDRERVHFVTRSGGRETSSVFVHRDRRLTDDVIEEIKGVSVTTVGRTAADVARTGTFTQAVCACDMALARGVTLAELTEHANRAGRRHGAATLRKALAVADGRSESVAESFSRAVMIMLPGIPEPEIQVVIHDEYGMFVARVDFLFAGKVVGEMDGRAKYRSATYGRDIEQVLYEEKLREEALRALGYEIVRWSWSDLVHPERLLKKLQRALRRAGVL